jgi:hypothetical protein
MDADLEKRVTQFLKDAKILLYSWTNQVVTCEGCKKLAEETTPLMAGLNTLLKELRVEK